MLSYIAHIVNLLGFLLLLVMPDRRRWRRRERK